MLMLAYPRLLTVQSAKYFIITEKITKKSLEESGLVG